MAKMTAREALMAKTTATITIITHFVIEGMGYDTIVLRGRESSELEGIAAQMVAIANGIA